MLYAWVQMSRSYCAMLLLVVEHLKTALHNVLCNKVSGNSLNMCQNV